MTEWNTDLAASSMSSANWHAAGRCGDRPARAAEYRPAELAGADRQPALSRYWAVSTRAPGPDCRSAALKPRSAAVAAEPRRQRPAEPERRRRRSGAGRGIGNGTVSGARGALSLLPRSRSIAARGQVVGVAMFLGGDRGLDRRSRYRGNGAPAAPPAGRLRSAGSPSRRSSHATRPDGGGCRPKCSRSPRAGLPAVPAISPGIFPPPPVSRQAFRPAFRPAFPGAFRRSTSRKWP